MCPDAHLDGVILVDQAAPDESAQNTGSHARLHVGKRRRVEAAGKGGMKGDARRLVQGDGRLEEAVDDAAVKTTFQCRLTSALSTLSEAAETKMDVLVQAGAEPVNEGDRSDPGIGWASRAMFAQAAFHHGQKNAQHRALQGRVALKEVAQPFGHGEHPLPHRQRRENVIDQVRGSFGHAPGVAGGAHATALAGVCDQEIVLALVAVGSGKAVSKDAAFESAAKCPFDMGRRRFSVLAAGLLQPGFEMGLDDAIP